MALCVSTVAAAQAVPTIAGDVPAATGSGHAELDEIVVTAQRRSENLQNVPISVTAADAAALSEARVINVENINALSPSITFRTTNNPSSSSNIQIRGIGTTGNARSFEGAVGVFVDGVYRTRSGQALQNFLDVDNLQVLRGPQGTLFGKNTSAGALLVTTNAPSTDALGGTYEAAYGNYDYYLLRGAINVPISDKLAVRVAAMQTDRDGYYKDPNGGNHNATRDRAVKAQILFKPTDGISFRLIGDYARSTGDCCHGSVDVVNGPTQPLIDALSIANGLKPPSHNPDDYQAVIFPRATPMDVRDYGGTLISDFDIGSGTLRSVTALRRYSLSQVQDADFSGADILALTEDFKSQFFSQDLIYTGKIESGVNANYVAGGFYSNETLTMGRTGRWGSQAQTYWDTLFAASGIPRGTANASTNSQSVEVMGGTAKSYAIFTHWDFEIGDRFNIIAGARYSKEKKSGFFFNRNVNRDPLFDPLALLGVQPGIPYDQERTDNAVSGTIGAQFRPAEGAMLYATYNRGFKAGGVNIDSNAAGTPGSVVFRTPAVLGTPQYRPEKVDAFEVGAKVDWFERRARTNVAVFYNKLTDLQVAQFLGLQFAIINAPSAKTFGVEVEQIFKLNDVFILNAAATWLPKADFGDSALLGALSGRRFGTAPKFAANVAMNAEKPITNDFAAIARLQMLYTSSVFTNSANNLTQSGYALLNGNIGIKSLKQGWVVEAYVQNLTDKRYINVHFNTPLQTGDNNGYLGAPRTFGVTLRGAF